MISFYTLVSFCFIHWIVDFYFQTPYMSMNKSKSNAALAMHVMVYAIGLTAMMILNENYFISSVAIIHWIVLNTIAHFFTDYVTSRATSALYEKKNYHDFFIVIGIDQFIHAVTLFGTFIWLSNLPR